MESISIRTSDGIRLAATIFPAGAGSPRGVVVVNAATGVVRGYYRSFAHYLAAAGFHALTYDYRGVGESRPASLSGFDADFLDWGQRDFPALVEYAAARWPGLPLLVVGHSIGGTILGMAPNHHLLRAAVTVGAQTAYFRDWPWPDRLRLYTLWHGLLPAATALLGYFPGRRLGLLEDLPRGIIRQWHARRRDPDFERQLYTLTDRLYYDRITFPILAAGLADDPIGSPPAIDRLHNLFRRAPVERRTFHPAEAGVRAINHFGFFRREFAGTLWPVVRQWLERKVDG